MFNKISTFLMTLTTIALLTVSAFAAPPANDDFANALVISGASGTTSGSISQASRENNEPFHFYTYPDGRVNSTVPVWRTVWFSWTAPATGPVVFRIANAGFNPAMAVYTGDSFNSLGYEAYNNDDETSIFSRIEMSATAGVTYKIAIGSYEDTNSPNTGYTMEWQQITAPTNDNFAQAINLDPMPGNISVTTQGGTVEPQEPLFGNGNQTIWFNFTNTAPNDLSMSFIAEGIGLPNNATLSVFTGETVASLTPVMKNDSADGSVSRATFLARAGATYRMALNVWSGAVNKTMNLRWATTKLRYYTDFGSISATTGEVFYDGGADVSVYRPQDGNAQGIWYWIDSQFNTVNAYQFGLNGDKPVPTDYDGDGRTDLAVTRNVNGQKVWYIRNSFDGSYRVVQFGFAGDKAVPGDYDSDGRADLAVYRFFNGDAYWEILRSSDNQSYLKKFGLVGDIPVIGDFKGTSTGTDIAVFRPSAGTFFVFDGTNTLYIPFGLNGDKPVVGDYDNDGKTDVAVFRPSNGTWYVLRSQNGLVITQQWGLATDIPVPGTYDRFGVNEYDFAVYRPSDGTWYINRKNIPNPDYIKFGLSTDIPVTSLSTIAQ